MCDRLFEGVKTGDEWMYKTGTHRNAVWMGSDNRDRCTEVGDRRAGCMVFGTTDTEVRRDPWCCVRVQMGWERVAVDEKMESAIALYIGTEVSVSANARTDGKESKSVRLREPTARQVDGSLALDLDESYGTVAMTWAMHSMRR